MSNAISEIERNGKRLVLLSAAQGAITTAQTGTTPGNGGAAGVGNLAGVVAVELQMVFTYGSGGTNATAYVQTSFDGGVTWFDIASFQATTASLQKVCNVSAVAASAAPATPTDGSLTANTKNEGLIGDRLRVKLTTTGTYAGGTTMAVFALVKG